MRKVFLCIAACCAMLSNGTGAVAQVPLEAEPCASCHGVEAPSPLATVPTIHGLPASVLENALYDFRAGLRPCRKPDCDASADCPELGCCAVVSGLSDEDIALLAQWYAAQPYAAVEQSWDRDLAQQGRLLHEAHCESCHTGGGADSLDQASILRGQPKPYLRTAMTDFQEERRIAVAQMHGHLLGLSAAEFEALLEFYASPR